MRPGIFRITPRGYLYAIHVRGRTSDPVLFYNIFCMGGYPLVNMPNVQTIVDAGANVGYFSVFAAHHYPGARILAIEPEGSNFLVLRENVRPYSDVVPLRAGLWDEEGKIIIDDLSAEKWCFKCASVDSRVENAEGEEVIAITIQSILRDHQLPSIDLLKMDIEGGEKVVFSAADTTWLSKVRIMICELHPGCWRSFFDALRPFDYDCRQVGENIVVLLHALASVSGLLRHSRR